MQLADSVKALPDCPTEAIGEASTRPPPAHPSAKSAGERTGGGLGDDARRPVALSGSLSSSGGRREYFRSVARIGVQAAEALEHAHQMGVVHRDIKPSNMMLDVDGHLWITDFGLAMFEANPDLTMSGMILGTLRYMSPEQMRGDRRVLDHRTDVYSLGVTLYEMLALQPAFPESDPKHLLERIPSSDPPSPRRVRPDVPRDLATIVTKAIAKDPADRYRTAQELAEDLKCFLADRPIRAKRPALSEIVGKWMRRNTAAVSFWIFLFMIATVGLFAGTLMISREHARTQVALNTAQANYQETEKQRARAEEALAELRRQARFTSEVAYASDIQMVVSAWQRGDSVQQAELLSRHIPSDGQPDLRGFEWYYLWQQTHLQHFDVISGGEPLYCVCYSPDGKRLAVAGKESVLRVFDTNRWRQAWSLDTGQGEVNGLAFHPNGTQLVSAGDDGTLRIWDTARREQILQIQAHEGLAYQVAFTPDGRELISCGKEPVVRVWDPVSGTPIGTFEGHEVAVEALSIASDGQLLGTAGSDGTTAIWDFRSRRRIAGAPSLGGRVVCCAFSDDSRVFAAGTSAGRVFAWDVSSDKSMTRSIFSGRTGDGVQNVAFAPGSTVLTVGDRGGGIRRWVLSQDGGEWSSVGMHWIGHGARVYGMAFSPDGRQLVTTGADGALKVWADRGRQRWQPLSDLQFEDMARPATSSTLVTAGQNAGVYRWNLDTGEHLRLPLPENGMWDEVAMSLDTETLAVGNDRGEVLIWSIPEAREVRRWKIREQAEIYRLALSTDAGLLAATLWTSDDTVHLFDVRTGTELAPVPAKQSEAIAFSPDGRQLAAGDWNDIVIYDMANRRRLTSLPSQADTVVGLEFEPLGDWLASTGSDRRLVVWDLETGRERFSHIAHATKATMLAVSPDGRTIATASDQRVLKLWSVPTSQLLAEFPPEDRWYRDAVFSADGRKLVCLDTDGIVRIYDGGSPSAPTSVDDPIRVLPEQSE